jgi:hypothetical protein
VDVAKHVCILLQTIKVVELKWSYLCSASSFFIFLSNARALVRGMSGWQPLLSKGERNWQFFGTLCNLSPSMFNIDLINGTWVSVDWDATCCDNVAPGVNIMNASSSSLNSSSSSDGSTRSWCWAASCFGLVGVCMDSSIAMLSSYRHATFIVMCKLNWRGILYWHYNKNLL